MIPLILSIFSSTIVLVIFKFFKKFKIDTFQAIVFNYFTAALIGFSLYIDDWSSNVLEDIQWVPYSLACAILFISLFFIIGKGSQLNGVSSTAIAVKMSMAISIILIIFAYSEKLSFFKSIGISFAFIGVLLISLPNQNLKDKTNAGWMLILLFIGSGLLDFTLNFIQKNILVSMKPSLFTAISLGSAGALGSILLLIQITQKSREIRFKNILAGIILGVPNYFSIYLLLLSYRTTGWKDSTVLAITNVSVVLFSAIIGFMIFREIKTTKKIIGLIVAILSIISLYIENFFDKIISIC